MNGFKQVLVERHIGAVLVGFILAQGLMALVSVIMYPIQNAFLRSQNAAFASSPPTFSLPELLLGLLRVAVTISVGLLLLKWLYLPKETEVAKAE